MIFLQSTRHIGSAREEKNRLKHKKRPTDLWGAVYFVGKTLMPCGLPQGISAGLVGNYMKRKVIDSSRKDFLR